MIIVLLLTVTILTILTSELLGKGRVLYVRLFSLLLSYVFSAMVVLALAKALSPISYRELIEIALSTLPLLCAWFGFRVHLSNSITLHLLTKLDGSARKSFAQLAAEYDINSHVARRIEELKAGKYLDGTPEEGLTQSLRTTYVVLLIRFLRAQ
jgi:hypothetical protein